MKGRGGEKRREGGRKEEGGSDGDGVEGGRQQRTRAGKMTNNSVA